MSEYLYVEPRGQELPFYVRVEDDGRFMVVDENSLSKNEWLSEDELRKAGRLSRAIKHDSNGLVPV